MEEFPWNVAAREKISKQIFQRLSKFCKENVKYCEYVNFDNSMLLYDPNLEPQEKKMSKLERRMAGLLNLK